jgi:hypothetical protein
VAIEDWLAALNTRARGLIPGAWNGSYGGGYGRFVDGTRPGLGHYHAADGRRSRGRIVALGAMQRGYFELWL